MIRRQPFEGQERGQAGSMVHRNPRPNNRLVMTAPRPRLHRLLSDDSESSSTNSSIGSDPEEIIRKNLFAPATVIQNDAIPGIRRCNYQQQQPQMQYIHQQSRKSSQTQRIQSILRTPPKKSRPTRGSFSSNVKRTGNDQHCALTAEITREISFRTPKKTPAKTPGKTPNKRIIMNPASRDLFRSKSKLSVPMTDSKLMNIQLTRTESLSPCNSSQRDSVHAGFTKKKDGPSKLLETPKTQTKKTTKIRKTPFPGLSARKKIKRCLTPPRRNFGSHRSSRSSAAASHTLSTSYDGLNDYRLTSTELDPAPFQVELPSKKEITVHSKICALMDGYTAIHRDFNFAMLSGVSRPTLEKEYERSTSDKPMIAGSCHRSVIKKLLGCADDLVVEGFFREYTEESAEKESERMEACILSSESLRQIIVCFRGSTANQAKPLSKSNLFGAKQASIILHEEQKVPILDTFRSVYFGTALEKTVFALLANLATRKPFFDVVMTGHSFGAAMASIASLRYASSNSQMRVSCHVFGSPRIGGDEWRQLVHSVPNLRVYRAENGSDPYVLLPSGNEWIHCGHAIRVNDDAEFKARRFDRDRSSTTSNNSNLLGFVQSKVNPKNLAQSSQGKVDHEIQSYVDKFTNSGDKWFSDFCGLKGKGVSGTNNEMRMLA